jgi:hypothetical protein
MASVLFPNWLLELHPEIPRAASAIEETKIFFTNELSTAYTYPRLGQIQANIAYEEGKRLGMIVPDGRGGYAPDLTKAEQFSTLDMNKRRIIIYNWAQEYHKLKTYNYARKAICLRLLDGVSIGMNMKNLLIALPSMRCIIEHIGQMHLLMLNLQGILDQGGNLNLPALWTRYAEEITKRTYATRIDWIKLRTADFKIDKAKSFEYRKSEYFADMEAADLLKGVDKLEKRVKGARLAYDVLCEFTHPNYGIIFAVTERMKPEKDENGIDWQKRTIGLGSPGYMTSVAKQILIDTFLVFADLFSLLKSLSLETEAIEKRTLKHIQAIMRETLKVERNLFGRNDSCPCGSGIKVKRCCGSPEAS